MFKKGDIVRFKTKFEIVVIDDNLFKITDDNGRTTWHYQYELELVKPACQKETKLNPKNWNEVMEIGKKVYGEPKTESLEECTKKIIGSPNASVMKSELKEFAKEIDKRLSEKWKRTNIRITNLVSILESRIKKLEEKADEDKKLWLEQYGEEKQKEEIVLEKRAWGGTKISLCGLCCNFAGTGENNKNNNIGEEFIEYFKNLNEGDRIILRRM